jgi:threonine dehydrogenase-like Zn-dependent dehydrogenase
VPEPGPDQVLVRVDTSPVSAGTEGNFFRHNPPDGPLKRTQLGYMTVGHIQAIGANVTGYAVGDRVLTSGHHQSHWLVTVDPTAQELGTGKYIEKLDDAVSDAAAGFTVLGDVSLHGVRRAQLQIDESVAVIGCGIVGQLTIQFARISGAYPIIAIDLFDSRLELAKLSGATHVINSSTTDPVQAVKEITGGLGAESVFHCAPVAQLLQPAMEMASDRGKVVITTSAPGTAQVGIQVELMRKELSIIGVYQTGMDQPNNYWHWSRPRNRRACLRMLASGDLKIDPLVSHIVPYTEAAAMFEMMRRGGDDWMGIAFTWDKLS